jgi:autotransporter adhesin
MNRISIASRVLVATPLACAAMLIAATPAHGQRLTCYLLAAGGPVAFQVCGNAIGTNSIALGLGTASGERSVILGPDSTASATNSVALGFGSIADRPNTVSVGVGPFGGGLGPPRRQITNVAAGTESGDAVNLFQLETAIINAGVTTANQINVVRAAATNAQTTADTALDNAATAQSTADSALAQSNSNAAQIAAQAGQISDIQQVNTTQSSQIAALQAAGSGQASQIAALQSSSATQALQIGALQQGQAQLFDLVQLNRREARRGIAAAVALAPAPFPSAPGRTSYTANTAAYRGEVAFSAAIAHRLNAAAPFAITAGISHSGGRDTAARIGVAGEF